MSRRFCRLYHGSAEDIIEELERGERPRSEFSVEELRAAVINLAGQVKQLQRAQRHVLTEEQLVAAVRRSSPRFKRLLRES